MRFLSLNTKVAIVVLASMLVAVGVMFTRLAEADDNGNFASVDFTNAGSDGLRGRYFKWSVFTIDRSESTRFLDANCNSSGGYVPLYGCEKGVDGNQLSSAGDFGTFGALELSVGYRPNRNMRQEVSILFHPNFMYRGYANYSNQPIKDQLVETRASSIAVLFSQILEFPIKASGSNNSLSSRIRPFIGIGAGVSRITLKQTVMDFRYHNGYIPGATNYNLAWMLMAGISAPVSDRVTLDFSLRYTNHGEVRTKKGDWCLDLKSPDIKCSSDSQDDTINPVHASKASLSTIGIQMSLRYSF